MRLRTIQVIAALAAAVAIVLAFIAAGVFIVSSLFILVKTKSAEIGMAGLEPCATGADARARPPGVTLLRRTP